MAAVCCCIAALIGIVGVVILSANAFAMESEDNTEQFLATIPCSRSKLFQAKLGFVLFLVLLSLIPLVIAGLCVAANLSRADYDRLAGEFGNLVPQLAVLVLVMVIVPALIASFGGSVIATILASAPAVVACWAYKYSATVLISFLPITESDKSSDMLSALLTVLMLATIFLAAWRMWTRLEPHVAEIPAHDRGDGAFADRLYRDSGGGGLLLYDALCAAQLLSEP